MKNTWNKNKLKAWFEKELGGVLEQSELNEILFRLLEHNGISRLDWVTVSEIEIDETIWQGYVNGLKKDKPVQYILGYEYFAGEKYAVNEHVLIPRPETEELVNWIFSEHDVKQQLNILEIGTGSGCIAISVKKGLPNSKFIATDISIQALEVAAINAKTLSAEIEFIHDDILNSNLKDLQYDIIVSNPPYIPIEEANKMDARVKDFEPSMALFTEEKKPLQFYNAIMNFALANLKTSGALYFELHEDYAMQVFDLAHSKNLSPQILKDIYGKDRMMRIKKGES